MSNILNSEDFGLKIYNRFPPKYREDDALQNHALRRYLQSLSDGGFKYSIDEINGIANLIDPDNVDSKILPILFKQYGLDIFNGIPEQYLRYLLPKLGEAWSKKGSLSVVEFITSSLSGIKTTSNVTYDDNGNPTIGVRLEMDYNLGDYFPEAEQFKRLLQNFVPFYCDISMLYSYLFYENQILNGKDSEHLLNNVHEIKTDGGSFLSNSLNSATFGESILGKFVLGGDNKQEVDFYRDILHMQPILESHKIVGTVEEETLAIGLQPIYEYSEVYGSDSHLSKIKLPVEKEDGGLRTTKLVENSAMLGEAVMGYAVFGSMPEYCDTFEDHIITKPIKEVSTFNQFIDTFTNKEYNTLNGNFITNGLFNYDIITIGDTVEIVY